MIHFRQRVRLEIKDGIARVQLSRADKRNALDLDMFYAIVDAQKALAKRKDVRVVILGGEGADFCSGLDLQAVFGKRSSPLKLLWKCWPWNPNLAQKVSVGWRRLRVPVIAAIQGNCLGGGLQIALGADFRLCIRRRSFPSWKPNGASFRIWAAPWLCGNCCRATRPCAWP